MFTISAVSYALRIRRASSRAAERGRWQRQAAESVRRARASWYEDCLAHKLSFMHGLAALPMGTPSSPGSAAFRHAGGFAAGLALLAAAAAAAVAITAIAGRTGHSPPGAYPGAGPARTGPAGARLRREHPCAVGSGQPDPGNRPEGNCRALAGQRHRQPDPGRRRAQRRGRPHAARGRTVGRRDRLLGRRRDRAAVGPCEDAWADPQGPAGGHARLSVPRRLDRGRGRGIRARCLPRRVPAAGARKQPARRACRRCARPAALAVTVEHR